MSDVWPLLDLKRVVWNNYGPRFTADFMCYWYVNDIFNFFQVLLTVTTDGEFCSLWSCEETTESKFIALQKNHNLVFRKGSRNTSKYKQVFKLNGKVS